MTVTQPPMTNHEPTQIVPRLPGRIGQATAVEQSRAVAEVQAAIVVAQQCPRDVARAQRDMYRSCAQKSLAEKAFFRYSRGGSQITGPSVQLARELARCFGNVQYGIAELRRDDAFGQSEMLAFAWDVETNTRSSSTFVVPHKRDKKDTGPVALTDMRDIYENNANNAARRLREMIFAILPGWYTEDAVTACYETLAAENGDGTLAERIDKAVAGFGGRGVTEGQLEQKLGAPRSRWTPYDLAQLQVIWRSLMRGEISRDEEFPAERVTAAEITGQPPSSEGAKQEPARPAPKAQPASKGALERLDGLLSRLQLGPDADIKALQEWVCGEEWTASSTQVKKVTEHLDGWLKAEAVQGDVDKARDEIWVQYRAAHPGGEAGDG